MRIIAIMFTIAACATQPTDTHDMVPDQSEETIDIPSELTLPDQTPRYGGCQEACWGSWQCLKPCGLCVKPHDGKQGKCVTDWALQADRSSAGYQITFSSDRMTVTVPEWSDVATTITRRVAEPVTVTADRGTTGHWTARTQAERRVVGEVLELLVNAMQERR